MTGRLERESEAIFEGLDRALGKVAPGIETGELGRVIEVGNGVATVAGFTDLAADELVAFPDGLMGLASNLSEREVGVILLGPSGGLREGDKALRTRRVVDVGVGEALLGRVVDALGRPLDDLGPVEARARQPVERPAPAIMARAPVAVPLQTGIKAVDAAIPIGRGQRELIVGDRQTGKTAIALDAILNQRESGVVSVYCAIGQRGSATVRALETLRDAGALERTVVVVAGGDDAPGLQYVAPYAATAIAEDFMRRGRDVLIVYDDLTRHARAYRELSLLLRRPPGREAYPGDIFYIHSRLLERATRLRPDEGGGSLTALPIVETQAANISAYIPTNLISITDGQIYLSGTLFERGRLPAVDLGKSVSRVGGKAQLPAFRAVAADLRLAYAQYEELESFARFGARLDPASVARLERGRRVREVLKQGQGDLFSPAEQVAVLLATTSGLLDAVPLDRIGEAERVIRETAGGELGEIAARIGAGEALGKEDREAILAAVRAALAAAGLVAAEGGGDGDA